MEGTHVPSQRVATLLCPTISKRRYRLPSFRQLEDRGIDEFALRRR